jgi:hypothetical protein
MGLHSIPVPASFAATVVTHDPADGGVAGIEHANGFIGAPASPPASPVPGPEPDVCVDVDEPLLALVLLLEDALVLECELDECPPSSTVVGVPELLLHATANPTPITANAADADRTNMCLSPFGSSNDAKSRRILADSPGGNPLENLPVRGQ